MLRLLAIVVWVGGIAFFAFVLAPVAFQVLPTQHLAGIVVGGTLRVLDVIGLICGVVFCASTALLARGTLAAKRQYRAQMLLVAIMLMTTAYLHAGILPAMEHFRAAAGGNIETVPGTNAAKVRFEELHKRSEQVEGAVLFCGLALVLLVAREPLPGDRTEPNVTEAGGPIQLRHIR